MNFVLRRRNAISSKLFISKELEGIVIFSDSVTIVAREIIINLGYCITRRKHTKLKICICCRFPNYFLLFTLYIVAVEVKLLVALQLSIESVFCIQSKKK